MDAYELINELFNSLNELINELFNSLNELISKGNINVRTTKYSNELIETLKIIENCISCKKVDIKENDFDEYHELIDEMELESYGIIEKLNEELIFINDKLNRNILCE